MFLRVTPQQWAAIAAVLQKPWPIEATEIDLKYWALLETSPDRDALGARWGWAAERVRSAVVFFNARPRGEVLDG